MATRFSGPWTPLLAAIIEAQLDRELKVEIYRAFKEKRVCPASRYFSAAEVGEFYNQRGQAIRGEEKIHGE